MKFIDGKTKKNRKKITLLIFVGLFLTGIIITAYMVRKSYEDNLKPISTTSKTYVVNINPGSTPTQIALSLKSRGIIRSDWAFEWYVRNSESKDALKAGTYVFNQNQSVQEIVKIIIEGKEAADLITVLPGKNLEQIKEGFLRAGFSIAEVDAALEPSQYSKHPALVDKPKEANLEGYLYPESFQKTAKTSLKEIISLSLDEMQLHLTPDVRQAIAKRGLTLHQAMTLASIIENEVSRPEDRTTVSQVFQKRLKESIRLESNATDAYSKTRPEYDTYKIDGLPPGPISTFTESAINSVSFPSETDWLYFVSGDDGKTHFAKTLAEHESNIQKFCKAQCGQ